MLDEDRLSRRKSIVEAVSLQVDILSGNITEDKVWKSQIILKQHPEWREGGMQVKSSQEIEYLIILAVLSTSGACFFFTLGVCRVVNYGVAIHFFTCWTTGILWVNILKCFLWVLRDTINFSICIPVSFEVFERLVEQPGAVRCKPRDIKAW